MKLRLILPHFDIVMHLALLFFELGWNIFQKTAASTLGKIGNLKRCRPTFVW
jgi:hypothetical protein